MESCLADAVGGLDFGTGGQQRVHDLGPTAKGGPVQGPVPLVVGRCWVGSPLEVTRNA